MIHHPLDRDWTLHAVGDLAEVPPDLRDRLASPRGVPAGVPGCVHTDLLAAGLIPDPYLDRNEQLVQWIGLTDWEYRHTLDLPAASAARPGASTTDPRPRSGSPAATPSADALLAHDAVELHCEGLDTVATLTLNGRVVGTSANMHHPHTFDIRDALRPGANDLRVTFTSALRYAREMEQRLGPLPHVETHPYNAIRKMACNFGWDWGPCLITAGIWKPIALRAWNRARIAHVRPLVIRADADSAVVRVHVDLDRPAQRRAADEHPISLEAVLQHGTQTRIAQRRLVARGDTTVTLELTVNKPRLWWPVGHGEQTLYGLNVLLVDDAREELDHRQMHLGLRTTELDTSPDDIGSSFVIKVNGKPILCKGANWIPDDVFPHRVTPERYESRLRQAVDSHMNMIRIWGGGTYESDTFFDLCDRLGLMVWQDFCFACAAYAEEPPLRDLIVPEVRHAVARLSRHPSLVIWNGCNENVWGYFDWNWKPRIGDRTWGPGYYLGLLPQTIAELDPSRPYWPASPYSGSLERHPLDDRHGNKHVWDAWNAQDYAVYRKYVPRFVSEFGWQGPMNWATLARSIPQDQRQPLSPAMLAHQKHPNSNQRLRNRAAERWHMSRPDEAFTDWHFLMQLHQARAVDTAVRWWRSRHPVCSGQLYWQINDCWPVSSWASVDGDGRLKLLWYATRRFFSPRLLTIQPIDPIDYEVRRDQTPPEAAMAPRGPLAAYACNDTDEPWIGNLAITRFDFEAIPLFAARAALSVPPRSVQRIPLSQTGLTGADDPASQFLAVSCGDQRDLWYFDIDRNLRLPTPALRFDLARTGQQHHLRVHADSLVRDLCLLADHLDPDASVNEQLVTLLPGESFTFIIDSALPLSLDALSAPPVLQCANRFTAP